MFIGRLLPIVRTFISFPAGVARMPLGRFIVYSTAGRAALVDAARLRRAPCSGANWVDIRHALQPFDLAIAVGAWSLAVVLFVWWRLGMPGRRAAATRRRRPSAARAGRSSGGRTVRNAR